MSHNNKTNLQCGGDAEPPSLQDVGVDETQSSSWASVVAARETPKNSTPDQRALPQDYKNFSLKTPKSRVAMQEKTIESEWLDFSTRVDMTPPLKITKTLEATIELAEKLLEAARHETTSWDALPLKAQAQMAFLINEDMHECFPGVFREAATQITNAVIPGNVDKHQIMQSSLHNFVCKDGDHVIGKGHGHGDDSGASKYQQFVNKHNNIWKEGTPQSTTIFGLYPDVKPILRFQEPDSVVCCAVSTAIIINYAQRCRREKEKLVQNNDAVAIAEEENNEIETVLNGEQDADRFAMNIARFLRLELTQQEKYELIFHSTGFRLNDMLSRAMRLSNPDRREEDSIFCKIELSDEEDRELLYRDLARALQYGPLHTYRLRMFDEYGNSDTCTSHGAKTYNNEFHAITVVGAARTPDENGGIMFLVQDSDPVFPFKNVGLNMLLQMGVKKLDYLEKFGGLTFPTGGIFNLQPDFVCTFSGGKRSFGPATSTEFSYEEWTADGGPLERWYAITSPDFVPSWAREK